MSDIIVDVRERDEYEAEHVEHSVHLPLSQFSSVAPGVLNQLREGKLLILCRSGNRAKLAASEIGRLGFGDKFQAEVIPGGILEWKKSGKPTIFRQKTRLPIMRQVQAIAGSLVLTGTLLGAFVHPGFLALSGFVGLGLTVAGTTGFCGMALLLARIPWNRQNGNCQN